MTVSTHPVSMLGEIAMGPLSRIDKVSVSKSNETLLLLQSVMQSINMWISLPNRKAIVLGVSVSWLLKGPENESIDLSLFKTLHDTR